MLVVIGKDNENLGENCYTEVKANYCTEVILNF